MKENRSPLPEIDFLSEKMRYRCQHASLRSELVARAMGARPEDRPSIVDATAGLGQDSFILAYLGFEITLIEKSPIIHEILDKALQNASKKLPNIINRMHLVHNDAILWLKSLDHTNYPQIIYLDPMFPERKKSASVNKSMSSMHKIIENDDNCQELLGIALKTATQRVVIKRPRSAPKIIEHEVNFSLNGRTCRFDIYLT